VSATEIIWRAAGSPKGAGAQSGTCRTCGSNGAGLLFAGWVRTTFTDWDKLTVGEIICHACQFCFEDANPILDARIGKPRQRMRNYSHFVRSGEWYPLSKGDKPQMRDLLLDHGTEVSVIAESGQKHIIFRARPGWWQFEESALPPFPDALTAQLAVVEKLYRAFSKSEIETGRYNQKRILDFGLHKWVALEEQIKPLRGTRQLELMLFLAQREESDDDGTDSGETTVPGVARDSGRLQEPVRTQHLEPVRKQHKRRGVYVESGSLF
jgi:hypothetical protein